VIATFGEAELKHIAFRGSEEAVRAAAPNVEVAVIAGADHLYTGARDALLGRIRAWLQKT
jgi:hypothetical protein